MDEIASLRQMLRIIDASPVLNPLVDRPALAQLRSIDTSSMRRHIVFP